MTNTANNFVADQNNYAMPIFEEKKKVYTVDEVQDILGIGLSTTYKLIKAKQFHSVKVGHRVLVSKKSFDEWLQL